MENEQSRILASDNESIKTSFEDGSLKSAKIDENISKEFTNVITENKDAERIVTDTVSNVAVPIENDHDLIKINAEHEGYLTEELIICSGEKLPRKLEDATDGILLSKIESIQNVEIGNRAISNLSKCHMPFDDCACKLELEDTNWDVKNISTSVASVKSEVLNLSTKVFTVSDVVQSVESPGAVTAVDNGMDNFCDSVDLPIDLSLGHKSSPHSHQLSDNDHVYPGGIQREETVDDAESFLKSNGHKLCSSSGKLGDNMSVSEIKRLQDDLRNEETKLVLLRKLRQNQSYHQFILDRARARGESAGRLPQPPPRLVGSGPPQLVRALPQLTSSNNRLGSSHHDITSGGGIGINDPSSRLMPIQRLHGQPPPLVVTPHVASPTIAHITPHGSSQSLRSLSSSLTVQSGSQGSPVQLPNFPVHQPSPQHQQLQQSPQHPQQLPQIPPAASVQQTTNEQSPVQRQAAAKLALRKQLEKTLLQIPPPKPPPPEM